MRLVKMSSTKKSTARFYILTVSALACLVSLARAQDSPVDRTALPLAEPSYPPITELDVRKATPPPRFEVKAPDRAPNVLVILLDNLGYGATKPFGGMIEMPTLERLAKHGLRSNHGPSARDLKSFTALSPENPTCSRRLFRTAQLRSTCRTILTTTTRPIWPTMRSHGSERRRP
jgi:hypothetical protein